MQNPQDPTISSSHTLYLGVGGIGTRVVSAAAVSDQNLTSIKLFDVDVEPFAWLCAGYRCDVIPDIVKWARTNVGHRQIATWLDPKTEIVPLRDLPDIFVRNHSRSEMRAVFLMHAKFVSDALVSAIHNCHSAVIVSSTFGSTGSTWSIELAELICNQFPKVDLKLLAVDDSRAVAYVTHQNNWSKCFRYWFFREITCKEHLRSRVKIVGSEEAAVDALLASSPDERRGSTISIDEAFDRTSLDLNLASLPGHLQANFLLSRAQPISSVVDSYHRAALACVWVAIVESRISLEAWSKSYLDFRLRDNSAIRMPLVSLSPLTSGWKNILHALALSPRLLGGKEYRSAFDALIREGKDLLSGKEKMDDSVRDALNRHRFATESESNEIASLVPLTEHDIHRSAVRHDFNSLLLGIVDQLLISR